MTARSEGVGFHREPGGPFDHLEKERYCQSRAKGMSCTGAANHAGVAGQTGITWERRAEIKERIRELRQNAEDFVGVSKGWIIQQLKLNAQLARESEQLKSSNEALGMIYKIVNEDRDIGQLLPRALDVGVQGPELQKQLRESFAEKRPVIDTHAEESRDA